MRTVDGGVDEGDNLEAGSEFAAEIQSAPAYNNSDQIDRVLFEAERMVPWAFVGAYPDAI